MAEGNTTQRWVKWAGPGEFRGEGKWIKLEEIQTENHETYWVWLLRTAYLPTFVSKESPDDFCKDEGCPQHGTLHICNPGR